MQGIPCLSVINRKGGVGKSTTSTTLSEAAFYRRGIRIIKMDWDGQMNMTKMHLKVTKVPGIGPLPPENPILLELTEGAEEFNIRSTIADIFEGKQVMPYPTLFGPDDTSDTDSPRIDVVAGNEEAIKMLLETQPTDYIKSYYSHLASLNSTTISKRLSQFCADPVLAEFYDLIIIDCPPTESPLFNAALRASTHVLCPYVPEGMGVSGNEGILNAVAAERNLRMSNPTRPEPLDFIGFFPNLVDPRAADHRETIENARKIAGQHHLPENIILHRRKDIRDLTRHIFDRKRPSVMEMPDSNKAKQEVVRLADYVFDRIMGDKDQESNNE